MNQSNSKIDGKDALVLFADLQAGIIELTQTNPLERLKKAVRALAQLAKLLEIPVVVTGFRGEDGKDASITSQIGEVLGELPTYHRTACDSFLNPEIASAIKATGRKTLLISGVATELAVQLPALTAADDGYRVYVVLDACGGMSERTEQAALLRLSKAGATTVSVIISKCAQDAVDISRCESRIKLLYQLQILLFTHRPLLSNLQTIVDPAAQFSATPVLNRQPLCGGPR